MDQIIYDTSRIFRAFMSGRGAPYSDDRCRIRRLSFESKHPGFLHPEDREIPENLRFPYLMIEPVSLSEHGSDDVLILTHGLNEGSAAKLFPWAYNLASRLNMPVLIFPMAFHMDRRSEAWGFSPQVKLAEQRANVAGNRKASPFNARISQRLAEAPDRFTRGGLQSYYDALDLYDLITSGRHPGCRPGAVPHFLGYSAGGYLALTLMLSNPGGRFQESRCILFASGAPLSDMHPASIFIVDQEAGDRLTGFLGDRGYEHTVYESNVAEKAEAPAHWMTRIFFEDEDLKESLKTIGGRCLAIAGADDRVITADGMARNLEPLKRLVLNLGIHEFPFTMQGPLIESYDRRHPATRAVISEVKGSQQIGEAFREVFKLFIEEVDGMFRSKHA